MKTKDDLKLGHINMKSFIEEEQKIKLEEYQEVSKYMEKLNQEMQHSVELKLEEIEMAKWKNSKGHLQIEN